MLTEAYRAHVRELQNRVEAVLSATGFDGLVLHSGTPLRYFADDADAPFRATPHFAHWLPLETPGNLLVILPAKTPLLIHYAPEDCWYEKLPLGSPFWAESFEIRQVSQAEQVFDELPHEGRLAFYGDCPQEAKDRGFAPDAVNPPKLVARLDWSRSYKTPYEVACIEQAAKQAAPAHRAAREAFEAGGSELEIHFAYLEALHSTESDLPYPNIIALDEKAATLHYEKKRLQRGGEVLLMDCGARHNGYACDITRTWTRAGCDRVFQDMVRGFDELQQQLCTAVAPRLSYPELHHEAHVRIGDFLHEVGILKAPGAEAAERGLTKPFFPHGLGHFLGIQVHDVAGQQREPSGGTSPPPEQYPHLRTTRRIEAGQVFTIEPGVYFIEILLRPHREGKDKDAFDWPSIERLTLCGGIRIEDNLVVTAEGARNLTRPYLA